MPLKELRRIRNLLMTLVEISLINNWIKQKKAEELIKQLILDVDSEKEDG